MIFDEAHHLETVATQHFGIQVSTHRLETLQGLGSLIRHREDRGVLAILDPRLQSRGYGRIFWNSLPPVP